MEGPCADPQNETGHPAHPYRSGTTPVKTRLRYVYISVAQPDREGSLRTIDAGVRAECSRNMNRPQNMCAFVVSRLVFQDHGLF